METYNKIDAEYGDSDYYVKRIGEQQDNDLAALLTMAALLLHAKENQPRSVFRIVTKNLNMSDRTVRRLLRIANDNKINELKHRDCLPVSVGHLDILSRLTDSQFRDAVQSNAIHRNMTRADIQILLDGTKQSSTRVSGEKTVRFITIRVSEDVVADLDYLIAVQNGIKGQLRQMREELDMESVHIEDHGLIDKIESKLQASYCQSMKSDLAEALRTAKLFIRSMLSDERVRMPEAHKNYPKLTQRYFHMQDEFKRLGNDAERINFCLSQFDPGFTLEDLERDSTLRDRIARKYE